MSAVHAASALPADWWDDPANLLDYFVEHRPAWHGRALCAGKMRDGVSLWFAQHTSRIDEAKAICAGCPVQVQCQAAGHGEQGTWAGEHHSVQNTPVPASVGSTW